MVRSPSPGDCAGPMPMQLFLAWRAAVGACYRPSLGANGLTSSLAHGRTTALRLWAERLPSGVNLLGRRKSGSRLLSRAPLCRWIFGMCRRWAASVVIEVQEGTERNGKDNPHAS
jgi:hypothetical protein